MRPDTTTILENEVVTLIPLVETDFEEVFAVAADPLVWEQHPNKDRYQREVFEVYFRGAIESNGAYKIVDTASGKVAGCTRVYDYNEAENTILIGYTFFGREFWGTGINHASKRLLLEHLSHSLDHVDFHIGANNTRSQISIQRLGATKTGEIEVAYYGEPVKQNFVYRITLKR